MGLVFDSVLMQGWLHASAWGPQEVGCEHFSFFFLSAELPGGENCSLGLKPFLVFH